LDSGCQEAGLVQDKHSYNENRQTYKRESVKDMAAFRFSKWLSKSET